MTDRSISHETVVPLEPADAFALFADRLGEWWPLAYTFAGPRCESATIEARAGGRWLERTDAGEELPWGDVRAYERGRRLVLGFAIRPDRQPAAPDEASELEVRFEPAPGGGTRVALEHRAFDRHGAGGAAMRENMAGPQGWPLILAEFRRAARLRRQLAAHPFPGSAPRSKA